MNQFARVLAEAFYEKSTVNKWECLTENEQLRWEHAVDTLEDYCQRLDKVENSGTVMEVR